MKKAKYGTPNILHTIFCRLFFCVIIGVIRIVARIIGIIPCVVRIIAGIIRVGVAGNVRCIGVIGVIGAVAVRIGGRRGGRRRLRRFVAEEIICPNGAALVV